MTSESQLLLLLGLKSRFLHPSNPSSVFCGPRFGPKTAKIDPKLQLLQFFLGGGGPDPAKNGNDFEVNCCNFFPTAVSAVYGPIFRARQRSGKHMKNLKGAERKRTLQKHPFGQPFLRTTPSPLLWRAPQIYKAKNMHGQKSQASKESKNIARIAENARIAIIRGGEVGVRASLR